MFKNTSSYHEIKLVKKPLLLQGPVGGYFNFLMKELISNGKQPYKINFNGGDEYFCNSKLLNQYPHVYRYHHQLENFLQFIRDFIQLHDIDSIILFGDCRPFHVIAKQCAKKMNIPVFVFEEGYIRPNYVTIEKNGVNANSELFLTLQQELEEYANYFYDEENFFETDKCFYLENIQMNIDGLIEDYFDEHHKNHVILKNIEYQQMSSSMSLQTLDTIIANEQIVLKPHVEEKIKNKKNIENPDIVFIKSKKHQMEHFHTLHNISKLAVNYWYNMMIGRKIFHYYQHHKDNNIVESSKKWILAYTRKKKFKRQEKKLIPFFTQDLHKKYFLVCLQVYNDSQILEHSHYKNNRQFIFECLNSFAKNSTPEQHLVIKQHPLDIAYHDYTQYIKKLSKNLAIEHRIHYVHEIHLPTLLKSSCGLVTINSTSTLSALYHQTPTKIMGKCFYDIEGLTSQNSLDSFWKNPGEVNYQLFKIFRSFLIFKNQIEGSFYNEKYYPKIFEKISE